MSLGEWPWKLSGEGGGGGGGQQAQKVTMTTLWTANTWHCHTKISVESNILIIRTSSHLRKGVPAKAFRLPRDHERDTNQQSLEFNPA